MGASTYLLSYCYTQAILWFPPSFLAVNHHNIENWVPSILTHNLWLIFMGMEQKKLFFLKKKNSKWPTKKNWVFQLRQFSIFFVKISWIGPWIYRINWCEGHWCGSSNMAVRLSNISSKTGKKCIFDVFKPFLSLCRTASQSYGLS
jgi:hypothetical protein